MLADGPIPGLAARTLVSSFLTGAFLAPLLPPSLLSPSSPPFSLSSLFSLFSLFSFLLKPSHQHQKKVGLPPKRALTVVITYAKSTPPVGEGRQKKKPTKAQRPEKMAIKNPESFLYCWSAFGDLRLFLKLLVSVCTRYDPNDRTSYPARATTCGHICV